MRVLFELERGPGPLSWLFSHQRDRFHAQSEAGYVLIDPGPAYRVNHEGNVALLHDGRLSGTSWEECERIGGSFLRMVFHENGVGIQSDRLGTIHLYWRDTDDPLVLGSSLVDVAAHGSPHPDELGALQIMLLGQPIGERTLIDGVRLLPPAVDLDWDRGAGTHWRRYWKATPAGAGEGSISGDPVGDLIERLTQAMERCAPTGSRVAFPVTGGLDSRINLALGHFQGSRDLLFTVQSPGDPEVAISRRIGKVLGQQLHEVPFDSKRWWAFLETNPYDGELHRGQCWLRATGPFLQKLNPELNLLDGYLQDAWINPRIVTASEEQGPHQTQISTAQNRWQRLGHKISDSIIKELCIHIENSYQSLGTPGLEANQRFYLENRSRRYVYDTVRLAQRHLPVALPGLDNDLMDFALSLPWELRADGPLYREAILRLSPVLAQIPYDKTGLPLTSRRKCSGKRFLIRQAQRALNRIWPRRRALLGPESHLQTALRHDPDFRAAIAGRLNESTWVEEILRLKRPGTFLINSALDRQALVPVALGGLTVASLEQVLNGFPRNASSQPFPSPTTFKSSQEKAGRKDSQSGTPRRPTSEEEYNGD